MPPFGMSEPILTGHKGFRVAGPKTRTRNAAETDPTTAQIGGLWQRYMEGGGPAAVSGGLDAPVTVAVYHEYESDHTGEYTLRVGSPAVHVDVETETSEVPDGSYLLFEATGPMPDALVETWQRIIAYFEGDTPYRRVYQADFELHDHSTPERVEVYVGVR